MAKFTTVGNVLKKKKTVDSEPDRYYMKFERRKDKSGNYVGDSPFPLTINEGDILSMFSTKDSLQRSVDAGKLSQEMADKIASFVRFDICKANDDENSGGNDSGGVNF